MPKILDIINLAKYFRTKGFQTILLSIFSNAFTNVSNV